LLLQFCYRTKDIGKRGLGAQTHSQTIYKLTIQRPLKVLLRLFGRSLERRLGRGRGRLAAGHELLAGLHTAILAIVDAQEGAAVGAVEILLHV